MGNWRDHAACAGMDTELWFPVSYRPRTAEELRRLRIAKQTCSGCPVVMECLEFAVTTGQRGIWGGLDDDQRRGSRMCRNIRQQALASA